MLNFDPANLAFQVLNFLVLLAILYYFLFRPLRSKLNERSRDVAEALQNARDQEAEAARLRAEYEQRLHGLREEADDIIARARQEAAQRGAELMEETRRRIDRLTADMREDLMRQRNEVVAQNYEDMLEAIVDLSANIVQSVTTRRTHDDLVQNFAASIYRLPPEEVNEYRRALEGRFPVAVVTTPVALTADQTQTLTDTLSSLADRHVELQVRVAPELVAGIQVRLANRLLDNTVRQQLNRIRERVREDLVERMGASA
jgi:F-type H+-transporting ATPase subunit b